VLALAGTCVALLAAPAGAGADRTIVGAPAGIVIEGDADGVKADPNTVLYAHNSYQRRAIASTTKLMTAYVAIKHASPGRVLTVQPYTPAPEETVAGLTPGRKLTVHDLLKAMLLPSGGDAAHTLAVDLAGSTPGFVRWMNAAARQLRMSHTHYSTPVGLDTPGNYSSASDLARLAMALMRNQTIAGVVGVHSARLTDGQVMVNRNDLVGRYPWVIGVKTGHTSDAGYCLVGAARRRDAMVISVVLGDPSEVTRDADTLALLRYGLGHLRPIEPRRPHPPKGRATPRDAGMIRS
jgi:D-alanyl-D-alanine carboxypeptidase (penicillin-binding protein 5/6)